MFRVNFMRTCEFGIRSSNSSDIIGGNDIRTIIVINRRVLCMVNLFGGMRHSYIAIYSAMYIAILHISAPGNEARYLESVLSVCEIF
jgi:hypothetical protein